MRRQRALIVEDEFQIGLDVHRLLSEAGFDVVGPIGTIEGALREARDNPFDVAVLDANLNGQHAGTVAESLIDRKVPFVVVSGYAREHLPLSMAHAPLLPKPFEGATLVALVQRACTESVRQNTYTE